MRDSAEGERKPPAKRNRPFLGVLFTCCHVYTRIYLNPAGTAFTGFCPKCGGKLTVHARKGGSKSRFWTAG
ncbi:MAG TPA: hypothetical protein PLD73_09045 [Candidatus Hydrogenedentes bacterium]|jgi:rRNA maturation endonuclease Nob1|nr:hypothetical protein [Candidatus Hydrogenedentota bacterium]HPJ99107.1 hypothetical protein [Candidatus Hydrogenedentota bacterium]